MRAPISAWRMRSSPSRSGAPGATKARASSIAGEVLGATPTDYPRAARPIGEVQVRGPVGAIPGVVPDARSPWSAVESGGGDGLPEPPGPDGLAPGRDRKRTRLNSSH